MTTARFAKIHETKEEENKGRRGNTRNCYKINTSLIGGRDAITQL